MSGLYIPNIELPTCCAGCDFRDALMCEMGGSVPFNRRLYTCPLVYVPDHGRLIDGNKISKEIKRVLGNHWSAVMIDQAPTIIPAEPAKEE